MNPMNKKTDSLADFEPSVDTEKLLLERLKNSSTAEDYFRWMLFVVGYYRGIKRYGTAVELLENFIRGSKNRGQTAHCHLALGQIATDEGSLQVALEHFAAALDLSPDNRNIAYVLHNNMGYCLNQTGRFAEAERYCRAAINLEWTRASAYRNLGVSFEGQGMIFAAMWALVEAIKAESSDRRARTILQALVGNKPEIALGSPWVFEHLYSDVREIPDLPVM